MNSSRISDIYRKLNKNNRGSTLLLVIVAMAFIGTIAAVILLITYKNLESVRTEMSSTANFYSAETALDEMRSTFLEWADKSMRTSYSEWLKKIDGMSVTEQQSEFKKMCVAQMKDDFNHKFDEYFGSDEAPPEGQPAGPEGEVVETGGAPEGEAAPDNPEGVPGDNPGGVPGDNPGDTPVVSAAPDINDLLGENHSGRISWNANATGDKIVKPVAVASEDGTKLIVKNISVIYKDDMGYSTKISTDLEFDIKYPGGASYALSDGGKECSEYVIISDGQIYNRLTGQNMIRGSLYAGGCLNKDNTTGKAGILIQGGENAETTIYADKVISRNDIEVTNGGKLTIKGIKADNDYTGSKSLSNVWVKGFDVTGDGPANMDIQARCYVNDDTTLSAKSESGSKLKVYGEYYGYNLSNYDTGGSDNVDAHGVALLYGTPEGSSSVILNSRNSTVDFADCDVWLAGKSFVSVSDSFDSANIKDISFIEGESMTYMGLQAAYLLPGDCITGIWHNPLTAEEFRALSTTKDADGNEKARAVSEYIDLSRSEAAIGIDLRDYVNLANPYRIAYVTYNPAAPDERLVYLYLNFTNANKAADYFRLYEQKNSELVNDRMATLENGRIIFNPGKIQSTGNCIGYNETKTDGKTTLTASVKGNDASTTNIEEKQVELFSNYSGLISALNKNYPGDVNSVDYLTDNIVDMSKIENHGEDVVVNSGNVDDYKLKLVEPAYSHYSIVTGNNITIDSDMDAIVIAKGNVVIEKGTNFNGLIIARGDVYINGRYNADSEKVLYLIQNVDEVSKYFRLDNGLNDGDGVSSSDYVSIDYVNWKKN